MSPPASLPFSSQVTLQTTVKWSIDRPRSEPVSLQNKFKSGLLGTLFALQLLQHSFFNRCFWFLKQVEKQTEKNWLTSYQTNVTTKQTQIQPVQGFAEISLIIYSVWIIKKQKVSFVSCSTNLVFLHALFLKNKAQISKDNYGMMFFMSKQVRLPKISSIRQEIVIGAKSNLCPFRTKAFNYF